LKQGRNLAFSSKDDYTAGLAVKPECQVEPIGLKILAAGANQTRPWPEL
jgi:hypothetical protein